jgi:esterase/lipase superfamily enzyme
MTERQFNDLLDETLFHYGADVSAEQASPSLETTIRRIAKRERYTPSDEDVRAIAALAYEQLSYT